MTRRINAAGLALVKKFEGCRLETYRCSAGKCTIGYGHTGDDVRMGMTISQARADELLQQDLAAAEETVSDLVKVRLSGNQHAALVSLVFNIGAGNFKSSTLLKMLNGMAYADAGDQFTRWVHAGGAIIAGLQRRRTAERELWFTPGG
jgi:lysozyme